MIVSFIYALNLDELFVSIKKNKISSDPFKTVFLFILGQLQYLKRMTFHIVIIPHRGLPPTLPQLTLSFALQAFPRTAVVLVAISEMR